MMNSCAHVPALPLRGSLLVSGYTKGFHFLKASICGVFMRARKAVWIYATVNDHPFALQYMIVKQNLLAGAFTLNIQ